MTTRPAELAQAHKGRAEGSKTDELPAEVLAEWLRIFDATRDSIIVLDGEFKVVRANAATSRMLGMPLEEIIGKKCWQLVHGTPEAPEDCPLKCADRTNLHGETELFLPDKGIWIEISTNRLSDDKGDAAGVVHVLRDVTDRRRTEQALEESEAKFRSIVENLPMGVHLYELQTDGRLCFAGANPAAEEILGVDHSPYLGKSICEAFPNLSDTEIPERFREIAEKGGFWEKHDIVYADEIIAGVFENYNFQTSPGKMASVFADITERKRSERREAFSSKILDILNRQANWRPLIRELLGRIKAFTDFEAIGIRLGEGDDFPYFETRGFDSQFVEAENYLCARDRSGATERDSNGKPYLECMCGNVISGRTDRSFDFFTKYGSFWSNNTSQLLATTSEQDRQTRTRNRCNSAGYESVALIPLRAGEQTIGLLQFNDSRTNAFTLDSIEFFERLGSNIAIAFNRIETEKTLGESQRKLLEQQHREKQRVETELANVREELVRTTRLAVIGQLSASIAHDLRNPLASIHNATHYLKSVFSNDDPKFAEYIGIIDEEVSTSDKIISSLLSMARTEEPVKKTVDLARVVQEVFERAGRTEALRRLILLVPDPFCVSADPDQLRQVITNVVSNAIEAMADRGEVSVEATRDSDYDTIVFRDTGTGFEPETRDKLFEPLITTKAKGTGLGLAICRQIIEGHGGTIDAIEAECQGAAIRIRLPRT